MRTYQGCNVGKLEKLGPKYNRVEEKKIGMCVRERERERQLLFRDNITPSQRQYDSLSETK